MMHWALRMGFIVGCTDSQMQLVRSYDFLYLALLWSNLVPCGTTWQRQALGRVLEIDELHPAEQSVPDIHMIR